MVDVPIVITKAVSARGGSDGDVNLDHVALDKDRNWLYPLLFDLKISVLLPIAGFKHDQTL